MLSAFSALEKYFRIKSIIVGSETIFKSEKVAHNGEQISEAEEVYVPAASFLFCCTKKILRLVFVLQPWF
jgi:hypothetical protein